MKTSEIFIHVGMKKNCTHQKVACFGFRTTLVKKYLPKYFSVAVSNTNFFFTISQGNYTAICFHQQMFCDLLL